MRLRRPLAALLLACATAAAGCGGDAEAKNAYVEDVRAAQQTFVTRFDQVLKRLTARSTLKQDRATLSRFAAVTASLANTLDRVTPPAAVRDEHDRLVAAVVAYRRDVQRAATSLRRGSVEDRARVRTELSSRVESTQAKITAAIGAINTGLRE